MAKPGRVSHETWVMYRGCLRKKAYWTLEYAEQVAKRVEERTGIKMHCYHCDICGRYHLTKQDVTGKNKGF